MGNVCSAQKARRRPVGLMPLPVLLKIDPDSLPEVQHEAAANGAEKDAPPKVERSPENKEDAAPNTAQGKSQENGGSKLSDHLFNGLKLGLTVLNETLDDIPVPGLKAVISTALIFVERIDTIGDNTRELKRLEARVKGLEETLRPQGPAELSIPPQLAQEIEKAIQSLADTKPQIKEILDSNIANKILNLDDHVDMLADLLQDVEDIVKAFMLKSAVETWTIAWNTLRNSEREVLNGLPRAKKARWNYAPNIDECMEGTRLEVLDDILDWLNNEAGRRVFWLRGLAGLGKSSIAKSVCRLAAARGRLGASFFCSRDDSTRKDMDLILPTLAFQLCQTVNGFGKQLIKILKEEVDVSAATPAEQVRQLIITPLENLKLTKPIVLVVDALDECDGERAAFIILMALSELANSVPCLKIFITSRPEDDARKAFATEALRKAASVQRLEFLGRDSVQADIRLFIQRRLVEIANRARQDPNDYESQDLPVDWPTSELVEKLVIRVDGFFIYAATLCKYAASGPFREIVEDVANLPEMSKELGSRKFDELYKLILTKALQTLGSRYAQQCCAIIGTIILLQAPLSMSELGQLFDFSVAHVARLLGPFHSVLSIPDQDQEDVVRAVHASFHDYLVDEACEPKEFYVTAPPRHGEIALLCFNTMRRLGLHSRTVQRTGSAGSAGFAHTALDYACRYWDDHLVQSSPEEPTRKKLLDCLQDFVTTKILDWVEYLARIEHIEFAIEALTQVRTWWKNLISAEPEIANSYPKVSEIMRETRHLLLEYIEPLNADPLQLYSSALPFLRNDSLLREIYGSKAKPLFSFRFGERPKRAADLTTLTIPYWAPRRIAISDDNKLIVCAMKMGDGYTFGAWESQSGRFLGQIQHTDEDGVEMILDTMLVLKHYLVTSWQDGTSKCWDIETLTLHYTSSGRVMEFMTEKTFRILDQTSGIVKDCVTGLEVSRLEADTYKVTFPSGLTDWMLVDWNLQAVWTNGAEIKEIKVPEVAETVTCSALVNRTGLLALGTDRSIAYVADAFAGQVLHTLVDLRGKGEGWFTTITFSEDTESKYVAGGGNLIGVWESRTGKLLCIMRGHGERIDSIAFTGGDTLLVTGSQDGTIKLWDWRSGDVVLEPKGHQLWVTALQFSFGGTDITSVSWDGGVCIWDAKTGKLKARAKVTHGVEPVLVTYTSPTTLKYTCKRRGFEAATDKLPHYYLSLRETGSHISILSMEGSDDETTVAGEDSAAEDDEAEGESQKEDANEDDKGEVEGGASQAGITKGEGADESGVASSPEEVPVPTTEPAATTDIPAQNGGTVEATSSSKPVTPGDSPTTAESGTVEQAVDEKKAQGDGDKDENDDQNADADDEDEVGDDDECSTCASSDVSSLLGYHFQDGWVLSPARERLLWIPQRYRATDNSHSFWGNILAIGGTDGLIAVLELEPLPEEVVEVDENGEVVGGSDDEPAKVPDPAKENGTVKADA